VHLRLVQDRVQHVGLGSRDLVDCGALAGSHIFLHERLCKQVGQVNRRSRTGAFAFFRFCVPGERHGRLEGG
jgi:hypothetical protein